MNLFIINKEKHTMSTSDLIHYFEDLDDLDQMEDGKRVSQIKNMKRDHKKRNGSPKTAAAAPAVIAEQQDAGQVFAFSYNASHHERQWLTDSLGGFYQMHWFEDVLQLIKGGKEASVYLCLGNQTTSASHLAAKVYRPRRFRNLRKDHLYREGRENLDENGHIITDDGMQYAMKKRTEFGKQLLHTSWIEHEVKTMQVLKEAGADVPAIFASGNNAILMTYVGEAEMAAPALNEIDLDPAEARQLFERVLANIETMLANDRVHGDLSAYNILYWDGEITLIDFPQAISPKENRNAYLIFQRDVTRVCEYFARQGVHAEPLAIAESLWRKYRYPTRPDMDPHYLDADSEEDIALWKRLQVT
jgi:RIO kinase 1